MSIEFNVETMEGSIDEESYKRLTEGTPFQRSINMLAMLAMLVNIMVEADLAFMDDFKIKGKKRKKMLEQLAMNRIEFLKKNPPPGVDPDALAVFCGQ